MSGLDSGKNRPPIEESKTSLVEYFAKHEPSVDQQTLISLFLQNVQGANATILTKIEFQTMAWLPYKCLHQQYYKNSEFITLLGKATQWSLNPMVYAEAAQFNLLFWQKTEIAKHLLGFFAIDRKFYEYLALSHAFMSVIRFMPLFPPQWNPEHHFISTLNDIEEENGRQIQVQIRLLKDMQLEMTTEDKERIVEEQRLIVGDMFRDLLARLQKMCV